MTSNIYNLKTEQLTQMLELILTSLNNHEDKIDALEIGRYGRYDDFIYAEILQKDFSYLNVNQRQAIMTVVRELINATSRAYYEMFEEYREAMEEMEFHYRPEQQLIETSVLTQ